MTGPRVAAFVFDVPLVVVTMGGSPNSSRCDVGLTPGEGPGGLPRFC